jgi:hypothetical protein
MEKFNSGCHLINSVIVSFGLQDRQLRFSDNPTQVTVCRYATRIHSPSRQESGTGAVHKTRRR